MPSRHGRPSIVVLTMLAWLMATVTPALALPANRIVVSDTSGTAQVDRLITLARPFREGEITGIAGAMIDGTAIPTQCDVKNRWPDGSLRFAILTFVVPRLPARGSVSVGLVNRPTPPAAGFLTAGDMLSAPFNFDGVIEMRGDTRRGGPPESVSARAMLAAGHWRYWLKGPLVTAIVIEDRSPARTYDKDFGDDSKALHPIFEAWFFPGDRAVELGYAVENTWTSGQARKGMRDLAYSFVLRSGQASPQVEFTQPAFTHIAKSRWHKTYRVGHTPGPVRVDHGTAYLATTGAIPSYDTSIEIPESRLAAAIRGLAQGPARDRRG